MATGTWLGNPVTIRRCTLQVTKPDAHLGQQSAVEVIDGNHPPFYLYNEDDVGWNKLNGADIQHARLFGTVISYEE